MANSTTFQGLSAQAQDAKAWPFEQARNLLSRTLRIRLDGAQRARATTLIESGKADEAVKAFEALSNPVLFETGYGPSGLPHVGTFGEVARTTMVRAAFRALTDDAIPTRLISFSDDMDGMRKVPDNVPNAELLSEDLHKPLTVVRDPFGTHESFGAHNNARLRAFLDSFGFDYEFMSSTEVYRSGRFDSALLRILAEYDKVMAVMLPTLGEERRETYSPFLPISPRSGKVLLAKVVETRPDKGTIVYVEEDGSLEEIAVTGGACKLQWKPDMGMRWAALGVDYEMYGKDHLPSAKLYDAICRIAGGTPPEQFMFELFLDQSGQKISKSKGNGLTMEEWLRYGGAEGLAYYMFQSPKSAKKLHFDVIPKASDEYLQQLDAWNRDAAEGVNAPNLNNPVWHVHAGNPPAKGSPVSFSLMLNLVSAANASDKAILWGFLSRYIPGATPESEPLLDHLAQYAINYYEDFVRPTKVFREPTEIERAAFEDLLARLKALPSGCQDAELIQNEVYAVGKDAGFEPLRLWFTALYEVLLGQSQGPRFGSFAAIFGLDRTIAMIESALSATRQKNT